MDFVKPILCCKQESFRKTITANHLTLSFCFVQKFPGSVGSRGIIHIKNSNYGGISYRHIVADGKIKSEAKRS